MSRRFWAGAIIAAAALTVFAQPALAATADDSGRFPKADSSAASAYHVK